MDIRKFLVLQGIDFAISDGGEYSAIHRRCWLSGIWVVGVAGEKSPVWLLFFFSITNLKKFNRWTHHLNGKIESDAVGHAQYARARSRHNINTMVYYTRFWSFDSRPENARCRPYYIIAVSDVWARILPRKTRPNDAYLHTYITRRIHLPMGRRFIPSVIYFRIL